MAATRENEGVGDLMRALDDIGIEVLEERPQRNDGRYDAVLRIGKSRLPVEVKRDVRDSDAQRLVEHLPIRSLVVADRFSPGARALFEQHGIGWLDRRGHLRLVLPPGIFIDRDIDPLIVEGRGRAANPFATVGLDVAMALLLEPMGSLGVREISRRTGTSAGRVSELIGELRAQGLVNRDGTPAIPDLFEAVVGAWDPQWVSLGATPPPDPMLRLGGLLAGIWHGVSLVVTEGWPHELYVRDEFALRRLVRTFPPDLELPVVNHVIVTLDLAQDQGRGREALGQWNPQEAVRVW